MSNLGNTAGNIFLFHPIVNKNSPGVCGYELPQRVQVSFFASLVKTVHDNAQLVLVTKIGDQLQGTDHIIALSIWYDLIPLRASQPKREQPIHMAFHTYHTTNNSRCHVFPFPCGLQWLTTGNLRPGTSCSAHIHTCTWSCFSFHFSNRVPQEVRALTHAAFNWSHSKHHDHPTPGSRHWPTLLIVHDLHMFVSRHESSVWHFRDPLAYFYCTIAPVAQLRFHLSFESLAHSPSRVLHLFFVLGLCSAHWHRLFTGDIIGNEEASWCAQASAHIAPPLPREPIPRILLCLSPTALSVCDSHTYAQRSRRGTMKPTCVCVQVSGYSGVSPILNRAGADLPEGVTYTPREGSIQPPKHRYHPENWRHVSMFWPSVPCICHLCRGEPGPVKILAITSSASSWWTSTVRSPSSRPVCWGPTLTCSSPTALSPTGVRGPLPVFSVVTPGPWGVQTMKLGELWGLRGLDDCGAVRPMGQCCTPSVGARRAVVPTEQWCPWHWNGLRGNDAELAEPRSTRGTQARWVWTCGRDCWMSAGIFSVTP